jgi:predicted acyl esterase
VLNDPVLHGISDTDTDWYRARSMVGYAPGIAHPIHITGAFQDEQTGPRFEHLWEVIPSDTQKRLLMSNGSHGTQVDIDETWKDRKAWMDYWMRGVADAYVPDPDDRPTSVRTLLELQRDVNDIDTDLNTGELIPGAILDRTSFPLEDTTWTDYYLCGDLTLKGTSTGCTTGSNSYLSGSKRQSWSFDLADNTNDAFGHQVTAAEGPDELDYVGETVAGSPIVIDGPILARLYLSSTAPDTEVFVQVIDEDTVAHTLSFLQRGMLRAAHRAIEPNLSDYSDVDEARPPGFLYRPFRRHEAIKLLTPTFAEELVVEVFPVAHVLRPGHRLRIKVMGTPAVDSQYGYPSKSPPAVNTVFSMEPGRPSLITFPVVTLTDFDGNAIALPAAGPACGRYHHVRCLPE